MKEIIHINESSIEYDPKVGYLNITCELPFICGEGELYVENPNPDDERFTVINIGLSSDDTLEVHLNSGDFVVVKSDMDVNNIYLKKLLGTLEISVDIIIVMINLNLFSRIILWRVLIYIEIMIMKIWCFQFLCSKKRIIIA